MTTPNSFNSWALGNTSTKDLNSLIKDNFSQFFQSRSDTPEQNDEHFSSGKTVEQLSARPRQLSSAASISAKPLPEITVSTALPTRYRKTTFDKGKPSRLNSQSPSALGSLSSDKNMSLSTSMPDINLATQLQPCTFYIADFDPLKPSDSLEELFKDFNEVSNLNMRKSAEVPTSKRSHSTCIPPPLPPKPAKLSMQLKPPSVSLNSSESSASLGSARKSMKSTDKPEIPPRDRHQQVTCKQPIQKLQERIDRVKTIPASFSSFNLLADAFALDCNEHQVEGKAFILVRYYIDDSRSNSDKPYLVFEKCPLDAKVEELLNFWMKAYQINHEKYFVRMRANQIILDGDSILGNHLAIRKLIALEKPLEVCITQCNRSLDSFQGAINGKSYPLIQKSWSFAHNIEEILLTLRSLSECCQKKYDADTSKFLQVAKLLHDFLHIECPSFSFAIETFQKSNAANFISSRDKLLREAEVFAKTAISSFKNLENSRSTTSLHLLSEKISDYFEVHLITLNNLGSLTLMQSIDKFYVDVNICYNGRKLFKSSVKDVWYNSRGQTLIRIDKVITFFSPLQPAQTVLVNFLPREAILSIEVYGVSESSAEPIKIAAVAYSVFDCNSVLNDSPIFLPMWSNSSLPHATYTYLNVDMFAVGTPKSESSPIVYLQILNHNQQSIVNRNSQDVSPLSESTGSSSGSDSGSPFRDNIRKRVRRVLMHKHRNILLRNPELPLHFNEHNQMIKDDCDLIWNQRRNILAQDAIGEGLKLLPDILFCYTGGWTLAMTQAIPDLIKLCHGKIDKYTALLILMYKFSDSKLRNFAVQNLSFTIEELIALMPVFCECLKHEAYIANDLIEFLLGKCRQSLLFTISFVRGISLNLTMVEYRPLFDIYKSAIAQLCPKHIFESFGAQDVLAAELESFYVSKRSEKEAYALRTHLRDINAKLFSTEGQTMPSFFPPGRTCLSIDVEKSFLHAKSNARPMHLYFISKTDFEFQVLFKYGDDLRQDQLISTLLTFMNAMWLREDLDLKFLSYGVFPCTAKSGFIEVVPNAVTLCKLQTLSGGITGTLSSGCIYQWLHQKNPEVASFEKALHNFTLSTAAYCVATYILGVCDRHNDNVMILPSGHLIHIDYGRIFGHTQNFGPVNRDRTPFVLTKDMFHAINRSSSDYSDYYYDFVRVCCQAYNIVRKNADFIIGVVRLMIGGDCPELSQDLQFLVQRLQPHLTEDEATQMFTQKINESISKSLITSLNFMIHALGQTGLSGKTKRVFDFTLNHVSSENAPKITKVNVVAFQPRSDLNHERYYVFVCEVLREGSGGLAQFVFRRWSHFCQLLGLLQAKFSNYFKDPRHRLLLSLSEKLTIDHEARLKQRKIAIQAFLDHIMFHENPQLRYNDAIYTFFQQMPEDEKFTLSNKNDINHLSMTKSPSRSSNLDFDVGGKVEMKISRNETKTQLHVLVKRCVDLMTSSVSLDTQDDSLQSNVYVKLKLLPLSSEIAAKSSAGFKQKTATKNSSCPIFNQLFTFHLNAMIWDSLFLEISVCYYQFGNMNSSCVGLLEMFISDVFYSYGYLCGRFPMQMLMLFCMFVSIMFSNTAPNFPFSWSGSAQSRSDVTGLDLVVITATRIMAILSCYHQLQCVRRIGLRKILYFTLLLSSITALLFTVIVGFLFKDSTVYVVDVLPFMFLLLDVPKTVSFAKLVFVAESTSRYSYRLAIATTFQKLGPIAFLDFTVAVLVFAMGLILDLRYLQFVCFLSLLCVFSVYLCFITIYPSLLCLFAEVCLYGATSAGKAREFILECSDINCDFMYRSNAIVVKLKALISVGLLLVHTMNYLLNPSFCPYQAIKTTIGSNQPQFESLHSSTLLLSDPETVNLLYGYSVGTEHVILAILAAALAVRLLIGELHLPSDESLLQQNEPASQRQIRPGSLSMSGLGDMPDGASSPTPNEGPVYSRTVSWSCGGVMDDVRSYVECCEILRNEGTAELSDLEIVMLMKSKKIPGHSLEKMMDPLRAVSIRREFISQMSENSAIFDLPYEHMEYEKTLGACCENIIGYTQIPAGVVGPLIVNDVPYYVPMATTEGALVASTNRGCKALSGGVQVLVKDRGMTRAAALKFPDIRQAGVFCSWFECKENVNSLQKLIEGRSRFTKLQSIQPIMAGNIVFLRFQAKTGDAMGMNMVSQAVEVCLAFLKNQFTSMRVVTVSGNMCTDKKPSAVNWILGRGKKVVAQAEVPKNIVQSVLKTQVKDLVELNQVKNMIGSGMAGSIGGFNAHAANIITAIFIATGQDPAQNVESSNCMTILEETESGNLAISCTLPSLEVGTLGGGTILPAQKAALRMLGVQGASKVNIERNDDVYSNAEQLAAIIGACVVAGELSLLSALSTGDLVKSHLKLNRSAAASRANEPTTSTTS